MEIFIGILAMGSFFLIGLMMNYLNNNKKMLFTCAICLFLCIASATWQAHKIDLFNDSIEIKEDK